MVSNYVIMLCIFLTVYFGFVNVALIWRNEAVPAINITTMSVGITGIVGRIAGLW